MKKNTDLEFINFLYVIGALLVVLGHATANFLGNWGPPNLIESSSAVLVHDYIYTFHMPLFFCISGFVYKFNLQKSKYKEFIPFVKNKFKRLLIPYFVIGLLYVSPIKLIVGDYTINGFIRDVFINIILAAGPSQLWYLFTLFNIFMIFFFLNKYLLQGQNRVRNHIFLFIIFASFTTFIDTGLAIFQIEATLNNLLFFQIGYLACNIKTEHKNAGINSLIFIGLHIILFLFSWSNTLSMIDSILTLLGLVGYYFLSIWVTEKYQNLGNNKLYRRLRKYNLEIYLYHQQIIQLLLLSQAFRLLSPWLNITISFLISIVISLIIGYTINKFKNSSRYDS